MIYGSKLLVTAEGGGRKAPALGRLCPETLP